MKKLFIYLILIFLVTPLLVLAHPGNTDSLGCHTCYTNCSSWGLYYGEYHCHNPKPYTPIVPAIPSCPLNSYYDSLSDSCKCYSSYVVSGGSCISEDQYCRNLFGYNSRYNTLTDKCECSYGYIISGSTCVDGDSVCHSKYGYNSNYESSTSSCKCDYGYVFDATKQCVSTDEYCQDIYGYHSEYSSLKGGCKCRSGYVFNSGMTSCIDGDTYCQSEHGIYSSYNSLSSICECDYGYELTNNQCVRKENRVIYTPITPKPAIPSTPSAEIKPMPEVGPENNVSSTVTDKPLVCDAEYALSFDKKHCIKIPKNAHVVDSPTDLWLCDDGYKELDNTCVVVPKEQKNEIVEEAIEPSISEDNSSQPKMSPIRNAWHGVSGFFVKIFNRIFK